MSLPQFALDSFPAAALIGGLLGIGILSRGQEIIVPHARLGNVEAAFECGGADQRAGAVWR